MKKIAVLISGSGSNLESIIKACISNKINGRIECVVSNELSEISIPFGSAQTPMLWDYADEIDTIDFLNKL